jgi:hypothetical protein
MVSFIKFILIQMFQTRSTMVDVFEESIIKPIVFFRQQNPPPPPQMDLAGQRAAGQQKSAFCCDV